MKEHAVIDRIEGDVAVLLVGEQEREVLVPVGELPAGSKPGVWLTVTIENDLVRQAEIDLETTRYREARIKEKMDRLLRRRSKLE